jgi:predicted ATPase
VPEAASDVIAAQQANGIPQPWTAIEFLTDILGVQMARQVRETSGPVVLFDRSPICTLALARYLGHPVPPDLAHAVERLVADRIYETDVFLVRPLGFIETTSARRISYEDALAFEAVHEATYEGLGFTLIEVLPDRVATRAAAVHDAIVALDTQRT